jgi:hypothetical protein
MTSPLQQKLKITGLSVVTANRLADGAVVYRTADGHWTSQLELASLVTTAPAAAEALSAATAQYVEAVDAYLAPIRVDADGRPHPGNLRERIRLQGPTIDLPITFGI